jgi:hypothetical protein
MLTLPHTHFAHTVTLFLIFLIQGLISPVPQPPHTATVWVMAASGNVLSLDATLTDWLGYKQGDIHGRPITDLVVEKEDVER